MFYRLYRPEDFAALYAIEELCFIPPHRFSRSYMRQLICQADAATWVAEEDGALRGFAIVEWARDEAGIAAYVQTLEVLAAARGQGVGGELLHRLESSADAAEAAFIWLHVDEANAAAIRLYEHHGFERCGTQSDYYGSGRAAAVYRKPLGD